MHARLAESSRAAELRRRPSLRRTGHGRAQLRTRSPPRSRRHARPQAVFGLSGGPRAPRACARALARRARRVRPPPPLRLAELYSPDRRARRPNGRRATRRRAHTTSDPRSSAPNDPPRAAGPSRAPWEYLHESEAAGRRSPSAPSSTRSQLVPAEPPSPECAYVLVVTRGWPDGGRALFGVVADPPSRRSRWRARWAARRRRSCARSPTLGGDLAYLGRGDEGLAAS